MKRRRVLAENLRSPLKIMAGLGISAFFGWLIVRDVNLSEVLDQLQRVRVAGLWPALALLAVVFMVKALRWRYQLGTIKGIALFNGLRAIVVGYMANNLLPLRAGDVFRSHLLARREELPTVALLSTVLVERIFDVASMIGVTVVVVLMTSMPNWLWNGVALLALGLAGGAAALLVSGRLAASLKGWALEKLGRLSPRWSAELACSVSKIKLGLETARGRTRFVVQLVYAFAEWLLWGLVAYTSLLAAGIELSVPQVLIVVVATNLAMALPAAPASLGVFEFAVVTTLEFYEVQANMALSGAAVLHLVFVIPVSLAGIVLLVEGWVRPAEHRVLEAGP